MRATSTSWRKNAPLYLGLLLLGLQLVSGGSAPGASAAQATQIDNDDIGGVVTSAKGPEAGVWVIAETKDLPTKFIKIVVTDDRGRYVVPDLPKASYDVWVRGYGLVDSPKVKGAPGQSLNLTAVVAPSARAAAEYYPANYWYALLQPPPKSDFPGTGAKANGIPEALKTQGAWIANAKMTNACTQCHQMGTKATREISPALGTFKSSLEAWDYRLQVGISGAFMSSTLAPLGRQRALKVFADWTDRIAAGELPEVPPRPEGIERNLVVTEWEWGDAKTFVHDEISTDRRNPRVNANGPVYAVQELSGDWMTILDPVKNTARRVSLPPADPNATISWATEVPVASPSWGEELIWKARVAPHNPMMDSKGRVWITARGGCRMFDPSTKTDTFTILPGCPVGHHLQIDDHDVLWGDGGGGGWFDTKKWDEARDDSKAGGRIVRVIDANGNGKLDENPVAADQPIDPTRDKLIDPGQAYSVIPNPVDGSVWISYSVVPGAIVRYDPKTKLSEIYEPPYRNPQARIEGYLPHGIDVDRSTGVIWTGLNSGHFASFDRRKCKGPLNGPKATGQHCPEGWTLYQTPGPNFKGVTESGTADSFYLNWTDWYDASGLGKNTPILTGTGSDSLLALVNGKFVVLRVPYPLGFHPRGMDGRIDDPNTGWKGRGLWSTHAEQATWHQEGGKGQLPKAVHFQIRPNPLAH